MTAVALTAQACRLRHKRCPSTSRRLAVATSHLYPRPVSPGPAALALACSFRRPFRRLPSLPNEKYATAYFSVRKRTSKTTAPFASSSHCSSVQERLVTYGSEALDTAEHLGLILGSQKQADALLDHFGSLTVLARASVRELLPFVSQSKALRLVSSLWMGAVALREERQSLTIDSPLAIADLCSEMRFLDREALRVVLLNTRQRLIKVCTVSQGSVNELQSLPERRS
jgi:hypothetical protein